MVAALFAVTFAIANPLAAFGVFLPVLAEAFGWSRGAISVALSINLLVGGVVGFGIGAVADRRGPRGVMLATVLLAGAGYALASTVSALWHFYLLVGVLVGVGFSSIYVLAAATVARWFEHGRGLALGIVLTGMNLGYVTGGPGTAFLIETVGWRTTYVVLGLEVAVVGGLASLFVRFPPGDAGSRARATDPAPPPRGMRLREALAGRRFWLFAASWFLLGVIFAMVTVHIVAYARDRGLGLAQASLAMTAYGVGAVGGRLFFGATADRFGARMTARWCFGGQVAALVLVLAGAPPWALLPLLVVFGLAFAGADTIYVKAVPESFGLAALGAIMGVLGLGWRAGAALGPALAGFVYDATGSYLVPFA
ncbi:MAG TPA: MFS transporter, partial [Vicinamibacteria bacterium]|nr:MFS transporter [Vicinamibacteria bacterium]